MSLFAHNGHKADYPLIEKTLLNSDLFTLEKQCASGMAKISYTWKVMGDFSDKNLYVQFCDSLNIFKGSLEEFGQSVALPIHKHEVEHAIICR